MEHVRKCCICSDILKASNPEDVEEFKWHGTLLQNGREFWFCPKHSITDSENYIKHY